MSSWSLLPSPQHSRASSYATVICVLASDLVSVTLLFLFVFHLFCVCFVFYRMGCFAMINYRLDVKYDNPYPLLYPNYQFGFLYSSVCTFYMRYVLINMFNHCTNSLQLPFLFIANPTLKCQQDLVGFFFCGVGFWRKQVNDAVLLVILYHQKNEA